MSGSCRGSFVFNRPISDEPRKSINIKIEYMPEAVIRLVNLYNCLPYGWTSKMNDRLIDMTQPQNENVTVATMTRLPVMEYLCVTNNHGYVPLVVNTSRSFPHSRLITGFVTRLTPWVPLVEQELLTLLGHLSSPPVVSGVRVTRSLVLCVCFVDRCLSFCTFSFGQCFVFDIWILVTPLVSFNSSYWKEQKQAYFFLFSKVSTITSVFILLSFLTNRATRIRCQKSLIMSL